MDQKSKCPFNYTMEVIGDPWSVLILRDMVALGKKSFGEFLESEERIGTSVLTSRLASLEQWGVIKKEVDPQDARKTVYTLTNVGLDLLPVLYEIAFWGSITSPHPVSHPLWFESMKIERKRVLKIWRDALEAGSSFFTGPKRAVSKLFPDQL
jgi:DNA-binding HxlR family transcriptional regulator